MSCLNISNVSKSFAQIVRKGEKMAHALSKRERKTRNDRIERKQKKAKRNGNMSVYQEPIVFESNNVDNLKVNRPTWNDSIKVANGDILKVVARIDGNDWNVKPKSKDLLNKTNSLSSHHIFHESILFYGAFLSARPLLPRFDISYLSVLNVDSTTVFLICLSS